MDEVLWPEPTPENPEPIGIAVVYEFGPTGTTFSAPVEITITYTAAELEFLGITDEAGELGIRVLRQNESSGVFDIEIFDEPDPPLDPIQRCSCRSAPASSA